MKTRSQLTTLERDHERFPVLIAVARTSASSAEHLHLDTRGVGNSEYAPDNLSVFFPPDAEVVLYIPGKERIISPLGWIFSVVSSFNLSFPADIILLAPSALVQNESPVGDKPGSL